MESKQISACKSCCETKQHYYFTMNFLLRIMLQLNGIKVELVFPLSIQTTTRRPTAPRINSFSLGGGGPPPPVKTTDTKNAEPHNNDSSTIPGVCLRISSALPPTIIPAPGLETLLFAGPNICRGLGGQPRADRPEKPAGLRDPKGRCSVFECGSSGGKSWIRSV